MKIFVITVLAFCGFFNQTYSQCGPDPKTATSTNTYTFTPTYTITPTYTSTPTYTATSTYTATGSATRTYTPTFTYTATPTYTGTLSPTAWLSYTATPTYTATYTFTSTGSATKTYTFTPVFTWTPTYTFTNTYTATPSYTPTNTYTAIPACTNTFTPTFTNTFTNTFTFTNSFTKTNTQTKTNTFTSTNTPTNTLSPTATIALTNLPGPSTAQLQSIQLTALWAIARNPSNFTSTPTPTGTLTPSVTPTPATVKVLLQSTPGFDLATGANQLSQGATLNSLTAAILGVSAPITSATAPATGLQVGGPYRANFPTYTDGQFSPFNFGSRGSVHAELYQSNSSSGYGAGQLQANVGSGNTGLDVYSNQALKDPAGNMQPAVAFAPAGTATPEPLVQSGIVDAAGVNQAAVTNAAPNSNYGLVTRSYSYGNYSGTTQQISGTTSLSDATSNGSVATFVQGFESLFNGTTWDRLRSVLGSTGTLQAGTRGTVQTFSSSVTWAPVAASTDSLFIQGSSTQTMEIWKVTLSTVATTIATTAEVPAFLVKRSTLTTGGTAVTIVTAPVDAADNTSNGFIINYTANPTPGTTVATFANILCQPQLQAAAVVPGNVSTVLFDSTNGNVKPIVITKNTTQGLAINFAGATLPTGFTCYANITGCYY